MSRKLVIATLLGVTGLAIYKIHRMIERKRFIRERSHQLQLVQPMLPGTYEYTI